MMTRAARCPVDAFERGQLPQVCVLTGQPADGSYTETFRSPAGGQYWLLLLGLAPYVIVRLTTRQEARGKVPVTEAAFTALERQARDRRRRATLLIISGIALGLVAGPIGAGVAVGLGWALSLFALGLFVAGIVVDARTPLLRGHVERSGRWVVLENVHPAFAAAVEQQVRDGRPVGDAGARAGV